MLPRQHSRRLATTFVLEITHDPMESKQLQLLAFAQLRKGGARDFSELSIIFTSIATSVPASGSKRGIQVSQADQRWREEHSRSLERTLLDPVVQTWEGWLAQTQANSGTSHLLPKEIKLVKHVECDDKREVGLVEVVERFGASFLYISAKKSLLASGWGRVPAYCSQHLPPTCSFVVHNEGKVVQHVPAAATNAGTLLSTPSSHTTARERPTSHSAPMHQSLPSPSSSSEMFLSARPVFSSRHAAAPSPTASWQGHVTPVAVQPVSDLQAAAHPVLNTEQMQSQWAAWRAQVKPNQWQLANTGSAPGSTRSSGRSCLDQDHAVTTSHGGGQKALPQSGGPNSRSPSSGASAISVEAALPPHLQQVRAAMEEQLHLAVEIAQEGLRRALDVQARALSQQSLATQAPAEPVGQGGQHKGEGFRCFTAEEIQAACNGFDPAAVIGEGAYGIVYRGSLAFTPVAIKKIKDPELAHTLRDFRKEVHIHGALRHPNLVLLMGQCLEPPCLVYELLPRGSLLDCLRRATTEGPTAGLPWYQRFQIFADVVRALLHLHTRKPPIVHLDMKPPNILLDQNFHAKVADVGLAEFLVSSDPQASFVQKSAAVGTFGYIDPEFLQTGKFSTASDVFSVGQVLWDLLTGLGPQGQRGRGVGAIQQLEDAVEEDNVEALIGALDPSAGQWPPAVALTLCELAAQCCQHRRTKRPLLQERVVEVVHQLQEVVENFQRSSQEEAIHAQAMVLAERHLEEEREAIRLQEQAHRDGQLESDFLCPITQEVMSDPVISTDGHTYERKAIEEWFKHHSTSPMTNELLSDKSLIPNIRLRSIICQWSEQRCRDGAFQGRDALRAR